jgi:hypothetical protein
MLYIPGFDNHFGQLTDLYLDDHPRKLTKTKLVVFTREIMINTSHSSSEILVNLCIVRTLMLVVIPSMSHMTEVPPTCTPSGTPRSLSQSRAAHPCHQPSRGLPPCQPVTSPSLTSYLVVLSANQLICGEAIKSGTYQTSAAGWVSGLSVTQAQDTALTWAQESNSAVCSTVLAEGLSYVESNDLSGEYTTTATPVVSLQIAKQGYR